MWGLIRSSAAMIGIAAGLGAGGLRADSLSFPASYNSYGVPGLIDMPSALSAPDGTLGLTSSYFQSNLRTTLTFQVLPRLTASFRYSNLWDFPDMQATDFRFDRSLSLAYRLVDEGPWTPAVSIGLNDFLGTGIYGSEFVAATKHLTPDLRLTAGIGWGRFAGVGSFDNPLAAFSDRFAEPRTGSSGRGGDLRFDNLFSGPAAFFGGVEWRATDALTLVAEYSSDAYPFEDGWSFDRESPFNFGLNWQATDRLQLSARYLYGSELGIQVSYAIDPARPPNGTGLGDAPAPVRPVTRAPPLAGTESRVAAALAADGLNLHGLEISGATARVAIENAGWSEPAQALGRTARLLTATLPAGIRRFEITLIERGMEVSTTALERSDMEALEFDLDQSWSSLTRARLADGGADLAALPGLYPRLDYGIRPYLAPSLFDPDAPVRADLGVDLSASYAPAPGLILSGTIRQRLIGNRDEADRPSTSVLPHVRSDSFLYEAAATTIPRLTLAYYTRPGENLYARATAGLLEPMFAGLSGEVLWKPPESRLALGAELNYAVQRDFDQRFGLTDYDIVTGHLSAYFDIGGGFHAQVDAGRYLAGDWGATFALDREFGNGWRVGGFFTLTDVPFEEFGEGSFDKGIRISVPLDWISGRPSRERFDYTVRPVLRDGGARLNVDGRLYELVRDETPRELRDGWGRFWR